MTMRNIKIYYSWSLFILLALQQNNLRAQETDLLTKKVEQYSSNHLEEKLFLHTDKSVYLSDEICWFKIYNVDAAFHLPLALSTVAYIEILDNHSKAIAQEKVALQDGLGTGSIKLPNNIGSGEYTLRAYTNWMKNYNENFFFQKKLTIINTKRELSLSLANTTKEEFKIQLFPEGGYLVNELNNKVAFKITNQYGKGVAINATVLNEQGESVTKAVSSSTGIGNFSINPKDGHSYKLMVQLTDGSKVSADLPKSNNKGYTLQLTQGVNQKGSINISVATKTSMHQHCI